MEHFDSMDASQQSDESDLFERAVPGLAAGVDGRLRVAEQAAGRRRFRVYRQTAAINRNSRL
jgi:hypothetical protein